MLAVRLALDDRRYGWYVDRRAFGPDLYRHGRRTRLICASGATITAQEQLELSWALARRALTGVVSEDDFAPADELVRGKLPLPIEDAVYDESSAHPGAAPSPSPYGRALHSRRRPGFDIAPVMIAWNACVFVIVTADRSRQAFACIPHDYVERFVNRLDSGSLDDRIHSYLSRPHRRRALYSYAQTHEPALYDVLGPRRKLIAPEYRPSARRWRRLIAARQLKRRFSRRHDTQAVSLAKEA
jgi:hypothetical protein